VTSKIQGFRFPSPFDREVESDTAALSEEAPAMASTSGEAEEVEEEPETLLAVEDLRVAFDEKRILEGVSISVAMGEKVAVVGRNGCGKSTLVRVIVEDLSLGARIKGSVACTTQGVAYFPQRLAEALNYENSSVKDVLYMSCGVKDIEDAGGLPAVLKRLRLDGVTKEQPVSSLSGGEKARVAFANFLLSPCALLVLDEPTNHLDIPTRELLEDALKAFKGAALVVSHDRFFLREFATRVVEIVDGQARDHESWEAYSSAAPPQWHAATTAEAEFARQDAKAAVLWSSKKFSRIAKKEQGNVGLRRLSLRKDEFMAEAQEVKPTLREKKEDKLISDGLDPALLGPHAQVLSEE